MAATQVSPCKNREGDWADRVGPFPLDRRRF